MERLRRIVLLGNSVIVGTMGMSLRQSPCNDVISIPMHQMQELGTIEPDVVIFDLEICRPEDVLVELRNCPDFMLIGVSPDDNFVRVWEERQFRELTTNELMGVINDY